jgi:hypothetical protein
MDPDKLSDFDLDRLLEVALSTGDPESERRARRAAIRAINRIEPIRREAKVARRRRSRIRAPLLLAGWLVAGAVVLLGGEIADLLARVGLEQALTSPLLARAATWFSVPPVVFAVGLVVLLAVAAVSLRLALADD